MDGVLETLERPLKMLEALLDLGDLRFEPIRAGPGGRVRPTGKTAAPETHGCLSFLSSSERRPRGRK
jgi:hypothetical protein